MFETSFIDVGFIAQKGTISAAHNFDKRIRTANTSEEIKSLFQILDFFYPLEEAKFIDACKKYALVEILKEFYPYISG